MEKILLIFIFILFLYLFIIYYYFKYIFIINYSIIFIKLDEIGCWYYYILTWAYLWHI